MAYGSSSFGSESYGGSSNTTPLATITYFLSGYLIKANVTATFTLDAKLVLRKTATFTLDAKLVLRKTATFTLDANLQKQFSKQFIINASLFKGGNLKTFAIDAKLIHRREFTFTIDTVEKKTLFKTFGLSGRAYFINFWLSPWKCRKLGTIYGVETQTQAVVQLNVFYGVGTDNGSNIYCNKKIKSNFSDLRFTKQDGLTLLQYEIVSYIDGISAVVNVKIGYIPDATGQTDFFIYFGNSAATSLSTYTPLTDNKIGTLIETIANIPATNINGLSSITSLDLGTNYLINIVGSWTFGTQGSGDALYLIGGGVYLPYQSDTDNSRMSVAAGKFTGRVVTQYLDAGNDGTTPNGQPSLTNSRQVNPTTGEIIVGGYDPNHSYYFKYTGEGSIIHIYLVDTKASDIYGDNSGIFTANIYSVISSQTTITWAQQECRRAGGVIMRTHRVGMRIING